MTVGFHSLSGTTNQQQQQQQQLLINNIRNQLGGSGSDLGFGGAGSEEDQGMKNLSLIKSAIVDRSPSSSALAGSAGVSGGLTVSGFPGPASINRSKSNSKIDDRSTPTSFEMKNFEYGAKGAGGSGSGSGAGRNYKISGESFFFVNLL